MTREIDPAVLSAFPGKLSPVSARRALSEIDLGLDVTQSLVDELVEGVRETVQKGRAIGLPNIVVGLSGGLDSIVTAALCRLAAEKVIAITVTLGTDWTEDRIARVRAAADGIGIEHLLVDGSNLRNAMQSAWRGRSPWTDINIETRAIQTLIFQIADAEGALVAATSDLSEIRLGRQTEYFYGHTAPLAGLYKSEVAALSRLLDIDHLLSDHRPGCEGHWYDDEVFGCGYDVIDPVLCLLSNTGMTPEDIAGQYGLADAGWIAALAERERVQAPRIATKASNPKRRRLS